VHGDIRNPNILVDAGSYPRLIDFDWSREIGETRSPFNLIDRPTEAQGEGPIKAGSDDEKYLQEVRDLKVFEDGST
jgi:hypothetical protein